MRLTVRIRYFGLSNVDPSGLFQQQQPQYAKPLAPPSVLLPPPKTDFVSGDAEWRTGFFGTFLYLTVGTLSRKCVYHWTKTPGGDEASKDNCKGKTTADLWVEYSKAEGISTTGSIEFSGEIGREIGSELKKMSGSLGLKLGVSVTKSHATSTKARDKSPVLPCHEKKIAVWQAAKFCTVTGKVDVFGQSTSLGNVDFIGTTGVRYQYTEFLNNYHFQVVYDRKCKGCCNATTGSHSSTLDPIPVVDDHSPEDDLIR